MLRLQSSTSLTRSSSVQNQVSAVVRDITVMNISAPHTVSHTRNALAARACWNARVRKLLSHKDSIVLPRAPQSLHGPYAEHKPKMHKDTPKHHGRVGRVVRTALRVRDSDTLAVAGGSLVVHTRDNNSPSTLHRTSLMRTSALRLRYHVSTSEEHELIQGIMIPATCECHSVAKIAPLCRQAQASKTPRRALGNSASPLAQDARLPK